MDTGSSPIGDVAIANVLAQNNMHQRTLFSTVDLIPPSISSYCRLPSTVDFLPLSISSLCGNKIHQEMLNQ
jgi:hypothetical protein